MVAFAPGKTGAEVHISSFWRIPVRFAQLTAIALAKQAAKTSVPEDQCSASQRFVGSRPAAWPLAEM